MFRSPIVAWSVAYAISTCFTLAVAQAGEIITLTNANFDQVVPAGKEVDALPGDLCIRNAHIVAIIGKTSPLRNANMTVKNVGGMLIDLTSRDDNNDQLSAFYPCAPNRVLSEEGAQVDPQGNIRLLYRSASVKDQPELWVTYDLSSDARAISVTTEYRNTSDKEMKIDPQDHIRADGEFVTAVDNDSNLRLFSAQDLYWQQAYGIVLADDAWKFHQDKRILRYLPKDAELPKSADSAKLPAQMLAAGKSISIQRWIFPSRDTFGTRRMAAQLNKQSWKPLTVDVRDSNGPVAECLLELKDTKGKSIAKSRSSNLETMIPAGQHQLVITALGREPVKRDIDASSQSKVDVVLPPPGFVQAEITDATGNRIACKCDFRGLDGTTSPDFGPKSAIQGVGNLQYTPSGRFRCELAPGSYEVVISHGLEFDAVTQTIKVEAGKTTELKAKLVQSIQTPGWISADFHSHSSPSGDNTSSQRGRVLNLLAEHIEFAPCTEHARIDTYDPHLQALEATSRMATCTGMELTGSLLPVNHQNAFPLKHYPRTQDNGGPSNDSDPVAQIERLAMWDDKADKLVQMNHPNLVQILGDRDLDGKPDGGFEKMFGFTDVIEVHPPQMIFEKPEALPLRDKDRGNPMFHWMQMLNLGYRIPGVVNTDAHYNFHGSGWLRNYVRSQSDDPAQQDILSLVHACEKGKVLMTNGPYLEVAGHCKGTSGDQIAELGDTLNPIDGTVTLRIKVQCANWVKINRVQVFVNGVPRPELNFKPGTHAESFKSGPVVFEHTATLKLDKDAHLIVATIGEGESLGVIAGPDHAKDPPVAVANPIFVDTDGNGFSPNQDQLGLELPLGKK